MPDELKPNLEPIEEKNLELKNKSAEKLPESGPFLESVPGKQENPAEKEAAYSKILAKAPAQVAPTDESSVKDDAATTDLEKDAKAKVERLVNLAMQKGIPHAVKVARHLEDNYALDEFHDRMLADDLHDALVKKGLLKEL